MRMPASDSRRDSGGARARAPARAASGAAARLIALQRAAGNKATGRALARWIKHPDAEQKGVMVPDASADEYTRFNPPRNE